MLTIIKIGGNVVDNAEILMQVLKDFSEIKTPKILVHGGGKLADDLLKKLNIVPEKINGRRITDAQTLDIAVMVYAGLINKKITTQLQSFGCDAIGITGADLNILQAHKRIVKDIDYGFAGDIDIVNTKKLLKLLALSDAIVVAPITHDTQGQLLNTNADTITGTIAAALSAQKKVTIKYIFEKPGVLRDKDDDNSVIENISFADFEIGVANGTFSDGMIPKLQNAFDAKKAGVKEIFICGVESIFKTGGTKIGE